MMDNLLSALRALDERVGSLERRAALTGLSVAATLRRRGWSPAQCSPLEGVLQPRPADPARLDRFYQDLRRYHFRRLLQEAAELRVLTPAAVHRLEGRWGPRAVARAFGRLIEYGLLDRRDDTLSLAVPGIRTIGGTLEWFVAQVFMREFLAPAEWDVRIREIRRGGDFDVLTVLDGRLGYIECKGSPPYNVSAEALAQFVDRIRQFQPDFAIFLLDTTLLIERNIIANLNPLTKESLGANRPIARVTMGLYEGGTAVPLFVVTSRRSLVANLGRALRRLHGVR